MLTLALCLTLVSALVSAAPVVNNTRPALDSRGWFDVGYGLMLEPRDHAESFPTPAFSRRAHPSTRDLVGREMHTIGLDERGDLFFPIDQSGGSGPSDPKPQFARRVAGALASTLKVIVTYYTGHDLLNPSCVTHSKWQPTDNSHIAAVTIRWANKPSCGSYLELRAKDSPASIVVRVVDSCGGCVANTAHVDLSVSAFKALFALNVGLVAGVEARVIADPNGSDYDSKAISLYGPLVL